MVTQGALPEAPWLGPRCHYVSASVQGLGLGPLPCSPLITVVAWSWLPPALLD